LAHPHGIMLGDKEFGFARGMVNMPDHRIQLAPDRFLSKARRQLACAVTAAPRPRSFQLGNRRRLSSMNSFLNDLPGLHAPAPSASRTVTGHGCDRSLVPSSSTLQSPTLHARASLWSNTDGDHGHSIQAARLCRTGRAPTATF